MKIRPLFLHALMLCAPVRADAPKVVNDAPIIEDGRVKVDEGDVLAFLARIPESQRATFRTSYDRIASVADNLFIARTLAERARAQGLQNDPIVERRVRQAEDAVLADVYVEKSRAALRDKDLAARARELYTASPDDYRIPEQVKVERIVVNMSGRTRDQARQRAEDLYRRITSGKEDFLQLAATYSDDPLKTRNGGAYQYAPLSSFNELTRQILSKLSKGEVTRPFEDASGFEIYRLVDRKAAYLPKFEEVREAIEEAERAKLEKKSDEELVAQIRSSKTVVTNRDNAEALVIPIDEEKMKRAQEEAARKIEEESRKPAAPKQ